MKKFYLLFYDSTFNCLVFKSRDLNIWDAKLQSIVIDELIMLRKHPQCPSFIPTGLLGLEKHDFISRFCYKIGFLG